MATIIERDIHHSHDAGSDSSAATMIVTVVALVLLAGFALFFFRVFPFNAAGTADTGGTNINVEVPSGNPTPDSGAM